MTKDDGLRDFKMAKYTYHVGSDLTFLEEEEKKRRIDKFFSFSN